jgi:hypothetical protein
LVGKQKSLSAAKKSSLLPSCFSLLNCLKLAVNVNLMTPLVSCSFIGSTYHPGEVQDGIDPAVRSGYVNMKNTDCLGKARVTISEEVRALKA